MAEGVANCEGQDVMARRELNQVYEKGGVVLRGGALHMINRQLVCICACYKAKLQ